MALIIRTAAGVLALLLAACSPSPPNAAANPSHTQANVAAQAPVQLGPRPFYLIDSMREGALKQQLQACAQGPFKRSRFSIGHRGAPLQFPEHTRESYLAAARMGAGTLECDVTFTRDKQLVCRHAHCDLHTTTNILTTALANKCSEPFSPYNPSTGQAASARCCSSDISLAEFKSLRGKMDGFNPKAMSAEEYIEGTPNWRTDLYASEGTLMTHKESIALFKQLDVDMAPELKTPTVPMHFTGNAQPNSPHNDNSTYSQAQYAQQLIDEYRAAGVAPARVWPQSFNLEDIRYWLQQEPAFAQQAVYLDDASNPGELPSAAQLQAYADEGITIVAPPLWALLALDEQQNIIASNYARNAQQAGLNIIAWSLERSGLLQQGGGWYYQTIGSALRSEGDVMTVLDVLATEAGVMAVFSDWPATVSYYASCMGLD